MTHPLLAVALLLPCCTLPSEAKQPPGSEVVLSVRTDADARAISPLIYGTNAYGPEAPVKLPLRYGLVRLGGNRLTAYNWENNASNAGSDWGFQNDGYLGGGDAPGGAIAQSLALARTADAALLVTVPMVDHVAADKAGDGDVRKGDGWLHKRFKNNRVRKGGPPSATPDLNDDAVYQDEMLSWLKAQAGATPVLVALDNEPELWPHTHPQVHPEKVTYVELVERTIATATMAKEVWPEAEVVGFVSVGWQGILDLQRAKDRWLRGEFVEFFLEKLHDAEKAAGKRLVDYLDVHWYPEALGGGKRVSGPDTDPEVVEARLQAPRSLWDPGYREKSWVADKLRGPIRLIPRLQKKLDQVYPGTKLAITEWNYGAGDHISGGLATADVLGAYGREGVAMAAWWRLQKSEPYAEAAFALFRDYDGKGGAFGDTSVRAQSSDPARVSFYASVSSKAPDRLVAVAINKTERPLEVRLDIAPLAVARLETYALTAVAPRPVAGASVTAGAGQPFRLTLPPYSATVLVSAP